jgi:DNA-binding beta-propeller fold protein YncE
MTAMCDVDFDQLITAWFEADADVREPERLLPAVLASTVRTRRRPAWLIPERWISMQTTMRFAPAPRLALYITAVVILGLVVAFALYVTAQRRLPPPVGPARNGELIFDAGGKIYVENADGSGRVSISTGTTFDTNPVVSPDGTRVVYLAAANALNPKASLIIANTDGSNRITAATNIVPSYSVNPLAWNPDGQTIAIGRAGAGGHSGEIDLIDANGSNLRTLVTEGVDPEWSPDGKTLAFAKIGDADAGVFVVDANGANPLRISHASGSGWAFREPVWTLDGQSLIYLAGPEPRHDMLVARADGSDEHEIVPADDMLMPVVSPDGRTIAYVLARTGGIGVATVALDGTNPTFVSVPGMVENPIVWAPDGTRVYGYGEDLNSPLGIGTPPLGAVWSDNEILVIDPTGQAPTVSIPAVGNLTTGSWQRLAP